MGIDIKRGQFVTSINMLKAATGITTKKIRNRLVKLEKTGEMVTKGANKYTIITICNYNAYQDQNNKKGSERANKGQTKGDKQ